MGKVKADRIARKRYVVCEVELHDPVVSVGSEQSRTTLEIVYSSHDNHEAFDYMYCLIARGSKVQYTVIVVYELDPEGGE